jgi:hypothetical protein
VGVAGDNEVGLSYTGRFVRLDARHAFESGSIAFSIGAGARGTWNAAGDGTDASPGAVPPSRIGGYGFDVPLLVGWRSDAGIVSLWAGARGGLERFGDLGSGETAPGRRLTFTHAYVGGVGGLSLGFRHVHAALELETAYHSVTGTVDTRSVELNGVTLAPAGALLFTF